jgi:hypothetical protein
MALIVFLATYLVVVGVYLVVTRLAASEWGQAFKAVSAGMLSPLGILFALLVGFIAVECSPWVSGCGQCPPSEPTGQIELIA